MRVLLTCSLLLVGCTKEKPALTVEDAERLWHAWKAINDETPLDAEKYLQLHRETGISLRIIWRQIQRWGVYGDLAANGSRE